jgi:hypothetical protein
MPGRECHHCKQWVREEEAHDCWTTTETALTRDLSPDLREAWERLRETATTLGEQRIYASHSSIMFSRKACYFFVRPKKSFLEVCVFLGRSMKVVHVIQIRHRDEVEAPLTDWLREAYEVSDELALKARTPPERAKPVARNSAPAKKKNGTKKPAVSRKTTGTASPRRVRKSARD